MSTTRVKTRKEPAYASALEVQASNNRSFSSHTPGLFLNAKASSQFEQDRKTTKVIGPLPSVPSYRRLPAHRA
jgi:hypothetical protein